MSFIWCWRVGALMGVACWYSKVDHRGLFVENMNPFFRAKSLTTSTLSWGMSSILRNIWNLLLVGNSDTILFILRTKSVGLITLLPGKNSVWLFVSERSSLIFSINYLVSRKFRTKLNILSAVPTSFKSFRILCLRVTPYFFFHLKKDRRDMSTVCLSFSHCSFRRQKILR